MLITLMVLSCQEIIDCDNVLFTNETRVTFFDPETKAGQVRVFDSIKALDLPEDTALFDSEYNAIGYELPLNPFEGETAFLFYDSTGTIDTLRFSYKTREEFFGENCGALTEFLDLRVLRSTFDSAVLVNRVLTKTTEVNIEIYD